MSGRLLMKLTCVSLRLDEAALNTKGNRKDAATGLSLSGHVGLHPHFVKADKKG